MMPPRLEEHRKYSPAKTAPGQPGVSPTWAAADKDFTTTALGSDSLIWATVAHGLLSEVYYPTIGRPQLRDMRFFIVRDRGYVDLEAVRQYTCSTPSAHVPLPKIVHSGEFSGEPYKLTLTFLPDPRRATVLINYALEGGGTLVVVATPHLGGFGDGNSASVEDGLLYGCSEQDALCIVAEDGFTHLSAGFEGRSGGSMDLAHDGVPDWSFQEAKNGNVVLTGQLRNRNGVLALGFAPSKVMARGRALDSLAEGFESARETFTAQWESWGQALKALPSPSQELGEAARLSATVIKVHMDHSFPGGIAASLSTPWGFARNSSGGYHLVWPRDAGLSALALAAAGLMDEAREALGHLIATQQANGSWAQAAFPDGRPFMIADQLDEVATPVLLAAKLRELGVADGLRTKAMVEAAAAFIARRGPPTGQDRWEVASGLSPFTLALEVAALVAAAQWLEGDERQAVLDVADEWNERIEEWCSTVSDAGAENARYYVRIAPKAAEGGLDGRVKLTNRGDEFALPAVEMVGLDFSYLVRLALRGADDPVVQASIRKVDEALKVDLPYGALYHRFQGDGYGEHADGDPYDSQGIGRAWPLLAGERGHLAICAGEDASPWLAAMLGARGPGGLIPEQVWDADDIPEKGLFRGRPTGSAMPLVWAHAEFLKLLIASERGAPVERLSVVTERYSGGKRRASAWRWREDTPVFSLPSGRELLIESLTPFVLRFGFDGAALREETTAEKRPFGIFAVRFDAAMLKGRSLLAFRRRIAEVWELRDWVIALEAEQPVSDVERRHNHAGV